MRKVKREEVLNAIRERNEQGITTKALAELLGISRKAVQMHMTRLLSDRVISSQHRKSGKPGGESVYFINLIEEPKTPANVRIDDPVPEVSKHKPNQNHEGYNDPTATEAIKRMERHGGFMPGGIYKTTSGEAFLVLTTYPDTVLGYRIDFVPNATDTDSEVTWKVGPNSALVHTHRVYSVPFKRLLLGNMTKCPFESFRDILRKSPFNSCKKVEVPVEGADHTEELELCRSKIEELTARNVEASRIMDDTQQTLDALRTDYERLRELHTGLKDKGERLAESNRQFQIRLEAALDERSTLVNKWIHLANSLEIDATLPIDQVVNNSIDAAKKYKDLAEAPIEKDALGVSVADFERLKGERDVYKSIVDRVVEYWAS